MWISYFHAGSESAQKNNCKSATLAKIEFKFFSPEILRNLECNRIKVPFHLSEENTENLLNLVLLQRRGRAGSTTLASST
jgi:hypothetical protein